MAKDTITHDTAPWMSRCSPNLANYRTISMHFYAFRFRRRLRDLAHGSKPRIGNDAGLIFADCASDPYTDGRRTLGGAQFEQPRATTSKFVKAEALYFQSVAIREKSLGKDDGLVAESLNNIATLYLEMGRRREAEPYLGGTFDAMRQMFKVTASWPIGDPGVNSRTEHYRVSRGLVINSVQ